jgi:hypothetical protein
LPPLVVVLAEPPAPVADAPPDPAVVVAPVVDAPEVVAPEVVALPDVVGPEVALVVVLPEVPLDVDPVVEALDPPSPPEPDGRLRVSSASEAHPKSSARQMEPRSERRITCMTKNPSVESADFDRFVDGRRVATLRRKFRHRTVTRRALNSRHSEKERAEDG